MLYEKGRGASFLLNISKDCYACDKTKALKKTEVKKR